MSVYKIHSSTRDIEAYSVMSKTHIPLISRNDYFQFTFPRVFGMTHPAVPSARLPFGPTRTSGPDSVIP